MSLEAAILASSLSPPQYWEKYPNLIEAEASGLSPTTVYQTFLQISTSGYFKGAFVSNMNGGTAKLRITLDGVVTELIAGATGISETVGIVTEDILQYYNGTFYVRNGGSLSTASISNTLKPVPVSNLGSSFTDNSSSSVLMVIPQPLKFKSSLKVEYATVVAGSTSGNIFVKGGHA